MPIHHAYILGQSYMLYLRVLQYPIDPVLFSGLNSLGTYY